VITTSKGQTRLKESKLRLQHPSTKHRNSQWDTNAADSADSEVTQNDIGVNYWLAETAVLKADYYRQEKAGDLSGTGYNLGVGFSF
jgi:hypothetical protein